MSDYSDHENGRQKALDSLTDAFAGGVITIEEYESRAGRVQNARGLDEIRQCTADLPRNPLPRSAPEYNSPDLSRRPGRSGRSNLDARSAPSPSFSIEERGSGSESVACIMGDRRMTGDWLNGDKVSSFTLMGSTTLDLRNTALPPGRLKIDAFTLMGEIRIIVPYGLPVKLSAFPFMGEARMAENVERRVVRSEPYVEVSGFAMMGAIVIKAAD